MPSLTRREIDVLRYAAEGKSAYVTGIIMGLSEHTIAWHRRKVMTKLGTASVINAVARAVQMNLISVDTSYPTGSSEAFR